MRADEIVVQLHEVFAYLRTVLDEERALQNIPGVRTCEERLRGVIEHPEVDARAVIEIVAQTWISMNRPKHPFAEFFVWSDDFDERRRENQVLEKRKARVDELIAAFRAL